MSQQSTSEDVERSNGKPLKPLPALTYTRDRRELKKRFELHQLAYLRRLPQTITAMVHQYEDFVMNEASGMTVYQHLLTTATMAEEDGASDETIVCALLHDIGVFFVPDDHADLSAALLRPYVSVHNYWVLVHHTIANRSYMTPPEYGIEKFRDHPAYHDVMRFATYDVNGYKPQPHQTWSHFEPLLEPFFMNRVKRSTP